jgi:predicted nucleic acid-binding protein
MDVELLLELFDLYAELIEITSDLKICRDGKDNFLLIFRQMVK